MNFSNKLTILRILLAFIFMTVISFSGIIAKVAAFLIFMLASFTDFLDGWLARKRKEVTDLGKILDPVADKVLVLSAFLSFVSMRLIYAWMAVVIIIRELLITALRLFALSKGIVIEATSSGKHKTVSQICTIFFILVALLIKEIGLKYGFWTGEFEQISRIVIMVFMTITIALTVSSGFIYLWTNRKIIRSL